MGIDLPPKTMGRYQLLFRIAAGGMAEVFAARVLGEAGFQKLVALKRMLPNIADDEEFVTMFLDEAHVASNISNPHVVQTLDLGRDDGGSLYIVMELVVGVPLSRILKEANKVRKAVPVGMAIELIAQTGVGLDAAHDAVTPVGERLEIVHRDVSPQNILVGVDGRVRITDFGVARAVLRMTKTDAGRIKGKFAYCAPEQLRSEAIDRRADIFALGVVAWETLAGQRLFVADHPLATMERVTTMPILPLDHIRSKVPKATSDVVLWALEREPARRPPTAAAFVKELRRSALQAGIELPTASDITRFVQAAGGEPLRKMQNNIRLALAAGDADVLADSSQFQLIEEPPSQVSGAVDTDMERQLQEISQPEPDSSGISRVPESLLPAALPAPVQERSRPIGVYAAAGVLVLAMVGAGAFFLVRPSEPPAEMAPRATESPVELPVVAPAGMIVTGQITPEATPPPEGPEEGAGPAGAEPTPSGAQPRGQRPRPRQRPPATRPQPPAPMEVAEAPDLPVETMAAETMTAAAMNPEPRRPEAAMTEPATMRVGGLADLDAFDMAASR